MWSRNVPPALVLAKQKREPQWRLSPTIENPASGGDSEDKTSLITASYNKPKDTNNENERGLSPLHSAFVKIPLEDRTKYEKLGSNDITSDDSDSEFFGNELLATKKTNFKQIVANNIQEKIHAVVNKVDKTQVKVPIVRKIKSKVSKDKGGGTNTKKSNKIGNDKQDSKTKENSDNDSIGSASDLRTEDDPADELESIGKLKPNPKKKFDDEISESVKTCGSSAYHAECESVTTNEDNVSRVVVRVRMKRKDRMNESTIHTVIDEDQLSPSSADLLHQYGDKPLLLDDELDYDSGENTESKEEEQSPDELDVFAMAPFKVPQHMVKRVKKSRKPKEILPEAETPNLLDQLDTSGETNSIWTSTPKKLPGDGNNLFTAYLQQDKDLNIGKTDASPVSQFDEFNEPAFDPFEADLVENTRCSSDYGVVTVNKISSIIQIPSTQENAGQISMANRDLFGSEPFQIHKSQPVTYPNMENMANFTVINIENNNNNKVPDDTTNLKHISSQQPPLVTVNQSILITKYPEPVNTQSEQSSLAQRKYVNYSSIDANFKIPDPMLPIADNEFVNSPINFSDQDEEEEVLALSTKSSKKEKSSKYYLKEKTKTRDDVASSSTSSVRVTLPAILTSKVKGTSSYKKVSSSSSSMTKTKKSTKDDQYFQSNTLKSNNTKIGFSNLSFEDFPSDQELDILNPTDGASRAKTTPFEVIRNEKMLLEAEKKFGSLKRRTNLFS